MPNSPDDNLLKIGWYSYDFVFEPKEEKTPPVIPPRRCENCRLRDTAELFEKKDGMEFCCNDMKYYDWFHTCDNHKNWTIKKGRIKKDGDP